MDLATPPSLTYCSLLRSRGRCSDPGAGGQCLTLSPPQAVPFHGTGLSSTHFDPHSPPVVELPDSGSEPVKSHGAEKVKLTLMDGGPLNWWWSGTPAVNGGVLEISSTLLFWLLLPLQPNQKNFQFSWLQSQAVDYLETRERIQPPGSQQGGLVRVRARGSGCTWCWHPTPPSLASSLQHGVSFRPASPKLSGQKGPRLHMLTVRKALLALVFAEWT